MDSETKKKLTAKYQKELDNGVHFWPDIIYKDALMSLAVFILLILLATFAGVHDPGKADPNSNFTPRPEWYFLFLFKFLALYGQIPVLGKIEWIATALVPGLALGILTLMPFIDRSEHRYYAKRALPIGIMFIMVLGMVLLTLLADYQTVAGDGSLIPGIIQAIAGIVIPLLAYTTFALIAYTRREKAARGIAISAPIFGGLMVGFTALAMVLYPLPPKVVEEVPITLADKIAAGQDYYSLHCVECHGDDGKVTVIEGVKGLEGKAISPINSKDVLYTVNDASMVEIISYGRPDSGMNPFGAAYNPQGLTLSQIDSIVLFMRYTWDDRFEKPVVKPLYPPLAQGEVPTYETHIAPIAKRYCVSCHRAGKDSNDYFMTSYQETLTSGNNGDVNLIPDDPENSFLIQVIQGHPVMNDDGSQEIGVMPPKSKLSAEIIDVFIRWVKAGMPEK